MREIGAQGQTEGWGSKRLGQTDGWGSRGAAWGRDGTPGIREIVEGIAVGGASAVLGLQSERHGRVVEEKDSRRRGPGNRVSSSGKRAVRF